MKIELFYGQLTSYQVSTQNHFKRFLKANHEISRGDHMKRLALPDIPIQFFSRSTHYALKANWKKWIWQGWPCFFDLLRQAVWRR